MVMFDCQLLIVDFVDLKNRENGLFRFRKYQTCLIVVLVKQYVIGQARKIGQIIWPMNNSLT